MLRGAPDLAGLRAKRQLLGRSDLADPNSIWLARQDQSTGQSAHEIRAHSGWTAGIRTRYLSQIDHGRAGLECSGDAQGMRGSVPVTTTCEVNIGVKRSDP